MAKPGANAQLSLESAHICDDAAGIPQDHWSRLFFEHVFCGFDDADFAGMYEEGGRYPVSPSLLSCITILQYMFAASDRVATENTIMRRDWRIALGLTRDYAGFDTSVLCGFRQRLVAHDHADELFGTVLGKVGELSLLTNRRRLRVDATAVVADVARLSRAEVIEEAMRVVVCYLYDNYPELGERPDLLRLHEAYSKEVWVGGGSSGAQKLRALGHDGYLLLELCGSREVKGKETLAQILDENFVLSEEQEPQPRAPDERPKDRIATPHEPDVRYGRKRDKSWLGDKAHLVETADEGRTNFVTDVVVTDPRAEDSTVLPEIAQRARFTMPEADTLMADQGYASARNSREAAELGLELIAPPRASNRRGKIPISEFDIDFERQVARCPEGHESVVWSPAGRAINIRLCERDCTACPRRAECTDSRQGRTIAPSREYEQLQRDRQRATTAEFAKLYRLRAPIDATISELVHCCGLRRSRYRGAPFRALHVLLAATALNVRRSLGCLATEQGWEPRDASALRALASPLALQPLPRISAILSCLFGAMTARCAFANASA